MSRETSVRQQQPPELWRSLNRLTAYPPPSENLPDHAIMPLSPLHVSEQAMTKSAEIICIGTELLLGDIVNGNARYLAQQLAYLGIAHHYQTVVGDNPLRIQRAVAIACERSRLLIFTGGLGPTPDDLTMATLAEFFDVPLIERAEAIADLEEKFARRGRPLHRCYSQTSPAT